MAADPLREFAAAVLDSAVAHGLAAPVADHKRRAALIEEIVGFTAKMLASAAVVSSRRAATEEPLPSGWSSASPPAAAVLDAAEGRFRRELAHYAYSGAVLLGLNNDLHNLVSSWGTTPRVLYGVAMMVAAVSLGTGIIGGGKLWALCARLGSILSTMLLVVSISCKIGRLGWVAGVASAAVTAGAMATLWVREEPAAAVAVSSFCGGVAKLWRRDKEGVLEHADEVDVSLDSVEIEAVSAQSDAGC
ncbi:unnamed protein product [Urochloa humidicola]